MKVQKIEEYYIREEFHEQIRNVLLDCFSEYPGNRTYFKQLPDFRYLVWKDEELIGHMAVEHRVVSVEGAVFRVFGIIDLCIKEAFQNQKLATRLLQEVEAFGKSCMVDFLVLATRSPDLYEANGFHFIDNYCQWVLIQSHRTVGVVKRKLSETLMVKQITDKKWPSGVVDFLGPIF